MLVIDIVILSIVAISSLFGAFRGLVKESFSLGTWISAIFLAGMFSGMLSELMMDLINNDFLREVAAFAVLFITAIFLGTVLSNLISKLFSSLGLGSVDKVLGVIFGMIRGIIIVLLIIFISHPIEMIQVWYEKSLFAPYGLYAIEYLKTIFQT